jgi:hypothetical protein
MSKADSATLDALVEGLADPTTSCGASSRQLGEATEKGSMPLSVERIAPQVFSLAHYYRQNGDMMRDPDVVLYRDELGRWFPATYRQDGMAPVYTVALTLDAYEGITGVYRRRYASLRDFVRLWLQNLRTQHGIR